MLRGAELLGERGLVQGLGCAQFPSRVNPLVGSILKTNLTQWPRAARLHSVPCPVPCPAQIPGVPGASGRGPIPSGGLAHARGGRSEGGAGSSHLHFLQNLEPFNFPDAVVIQVDILKRGGNQLSCGGRRPAPQNRSQGRPAGGEESVSRCHVTSAADR